MAINQQSSHLSEITSQDREKAVLERYSTASHAVEHSLCCPVDYDAVRLAVLPKEIVERDYGCGDPSRFVREADVVLDLGSGGGKVCYIASQIVGPTGRVIGVDMNDHMLALARRYQEEIGNRIGYHNVSFHKGRIQDLALDIELFEAHLAEQPVSNADDWARAQSRADRIRRDSPLIESESIDVVVSNCVLNLVDPRARPGMFQEIARVLKDGGRVVVSDIVCDEPVPEKLRNDPKLWSGCISGAYVEQEFLTAFEDAGLHGIEIVDRPAEPWAIIEGIEFRSITVRAYKRKHSPRMDLNQAVIYKGPWKTVTDDRGNTLVRGVPIAICSETTKVYSAEPYKDDVVHVPPRNTVTSERARPFDARTSGRIRQPRETKGDSYYLTVLPDSDACCGGSSSC